VFRSKSPGFRVVSGSGRFHVLCLSRRRPRFTTVALSWRFFEGTGPWSALSDAIHRRFWNKDGTSAMRF